MIRALVLLLLVSAVVSDHHFSHIKYRDYKSQFEVLSVEVSHCHSLDSRCHFRKGTAPHIRIAFKPNAAVDRLEGEVRAKLDETYVPFHLKNKDACANANITCPLNQGEIYYYTQSVSILDEYPNVNVQVNWILTDPEKKFAKLKEICIIFLAKVVDSWNHRNLAPIFWLNEQICNMNPLNTVI